MVVKKYIETSLAKLEKKYSISLLESDSYMSVYFSKLAVIEYCGWIEETMDVIVQSYAKNRLRTSGFQESLEAKIRDTHGFDYKRHFRPMLVHVLGIIRCEKIQQRLDRSGDLATLKAELATYIVHRNDAAHTHVNRVLPTYPSPSVTHGSLKKVYPIFKKIYGMRKEKAFS